MATKWNAAAGPSRQGLLIEHDTGYVSDDEFLDRERNDRLLQKAINYLAREGGSDPTATYIDRVQRIDEGIVQELRGQQYPYDPQLYRQLRSLVREVQADFESVAGEESSVNFDDSDVSMEEPYFPKALYREDEVDVDSEIACAPTGRRSAEVLKTEFLYGGPNNDVEEWHKDFPAALPFGETLYMQRWEGMKIDYDLAESAKKKPDDDLLVVTNVPYTAVEARFGKPHHQFESGSRFKIPATVWRNWDEVVETAKDTVNLEAAIEEFNQGGDLQEQKDKDYAPRIFLPQVSLNPTHHRSSSNKARFHNANTQNTPTPAPRRRYIGGPKPAVKLPQTTAIRNFDQRRRAVTKGTSATPTKPTTPLPKRETPKPAPRALRHVQASPSTRRTLNHPCEATVEATQPTAKVTAISSKARKRKVSDTAYVPSPTSAPPVKKGKASPAAKTTKKPAAAKKPVGFVDDSAPALRAAPKQTPTAKKAPPAKKTSTKRKAKEAAGAPEVLTKDVRAAAKSSLKRGTTRSGSKFKEISK